MKNFSRHLAHAAVNSSARTAEPSEMSKEMLFQLPTELFFEMRKQKFWHFTEINLALTYVKEKFNYLSVSILPNLYFILDLKINPTRNCIKTIEHFTELSRNDFQRVLKLSYVIFLDATSRIAFVASEISLIPRLSS